MTESITSSVNQQPYQTLSPDGRYVVFQTPSPIVSGDTNILLDIYVHDRETGVNELVSVDKKGNVGNDRSDYPSISAGGKFVAFQSRATNLVNNDTNGTWDIFVAKRK